LSGSGTDNADENLNGDSVLYRPESKVEAPESMSSDEDVERGGYRPGLWRIPTKQELQRTYSTATPAERVLSRPVVPVKKSDGTILVDWYTTGTSVSHCYITQHAFLSPH
jgi:hypothetical protein